MIKKNKSLFYMLILALATATQFLVGCDSSRPNHTATVIEETEGGIELLDREFGECDESVTSADPMNDEFNSVNIRSGHTSRQRIVERDFPHNYQNELYPLRGSWRKTKAEIMDIVDRQIWFPEESRRVPLLHFFDIALLINAGERTSKSPDNSSTQRMQVYLRNNSSNNLKDWNRVKVWAISSGKPCGQKITTPTGVFKLDPTEDPNDPSKSRFSPDYYSRQFENARMFETMFLYNFYQNGAMSGVAIHGTNKINSLGRQDSGGCIRLQRNNSQCLYNTFAGNLSEACLPGSQLDYWGKVPSFVKKGGDADPEYLSNGNLLVPGYKVLVVIFNDSEDLL